MKILHIIDYLGFGGAQTVLKGIFEKQPENKDIFLFALRDGEKLIQVAHDHVQSYGTRAKYSFAPLKVLRQLIQEHRIQILHCHLFRSQVFGVLLKKFYFPDIRLVFHEQGTIMGRDANRKIDRLFGNYAYDRFIRRSVKYVDLYIAVSQAIQEELISKGQVPVEKITLLHNFVDLRKFCPDTLDAAKKDHPFPGIRPNDFVVGFAGRLIKRKGWKEYIEAARIVSEKITSVKFLIAGDGTDRSKVLALIDKYALQERVLFLGYLADMFPFYSSLHCFVMPSQWEPMGIAEIEAQASGIPVVASNVPGLNEVIKHRRNGLLFEAENEKDLAEKIQLLYHDRALRHELVTNALHSVKQYDLDAFLSKLNPMYDDLPLSE